MARYCLDHIDTPFVVVGDKKGTTTWKFDGKRYKLDKTFTLRNASLPHINVLIKRQEKVVKDLFKEAKETEDPAVEDALESAKRNLGMLIAYKNDAKQMHLEKMMVSLMARDDVAFDEEYQYLVGDDCVYDLDSHAKLPHSREFHVTKKLPVAIDRTAKCPETLKLIEYMFDGDKEAMEWFLEYIAVSLLRGRGRRDELVVFLWGRTADNGKTTLLKAICLSLGMMEDGYATWLETSTFSEKRAGNATQPELIMALGRCLAVVDEPDKGKEDASRRKNVSNMGYMAMRNLFETTKLVRWTASIINLCNTLPEMDMKDSGNIRRVVVIPLDKKITPAMKNAPRTYDKAKYDDFGEYLAANEAEGIVAMLLDTLERYQKRGYQLPPVSSKMLGATNALIYKYNSVARFLAERCTTEPFKDESPAWANGAELHQRFEMYCHLVLGHKNIMQPENIKDAMAALGYSNHSFKRNDKTIRGYEGIRLLEDDELEKTTGGVPDSKEDLKRTIRIVVDSMSSHTINMRKWSNRNEAVEAVMKRGYPKEIIDAEIDRMVGNKLESIIWYNEQYLRIKGAEE